MITKSAYCTKSKSIYRLQLLFRNNKREIHMVEVNMVALNRDGNKQIVKKDGRSTLAHGHYYVLTPSWGHITKIAYCSWNF